MPFALSSALLVAFAALGAVGCDDEDPAPPIDAALEDGPPPAGRDMRSDGPEPDAGAAPDISIEPRTLTLLADVGEASAPGIITLSNVGDAPLTVSVLLLDPLRPEFAFAEPPALPAVIPPGGALPVPITYTARVAGDVQSTLTIQSDDPDEDRLTLPIAGRDRRSCVRAMPSRVDLGSIAIGGQTGEFRVQIENCGDRPVQIGEIALDGDAGFGWEVGQGMGSGQSLRPGDVLTLLLWYENTELPPDGMARTVLVVPTDLPTGDLRINVTVRGGGGPTCALVIEPEQVDYMTLRLGATRPVELTVRNEGSAHCELRDVAVEPQTGAPANTFVVEQGLEGDRIEGSSEATIVVAYAPVEANPLGERAELRVSYHDPHRVQNRTATARLIGIGAEAQIGADPVMVDTGLTTEGCFSWARSTTVSNVGFVPICVSGFRYEGEDCARIVPTEEPSIPEGQCTALERNEGLRFTFRHGPVAVGADRCTLIVESDAQNTDALAVPLEGTGTDTAETVDEAEVGNLNRLRDAYFPLSRPADGETLRLFVNDEETDRFDFDAGRNALVFEANRHPARRGDAIRMTYQAACLQLEE